MQVWLSSILRETTSIAYPIHIFISLVSFGESYFLWFLKPCFQSLLREIQKFSTLKPAAMLTVQENTTEVALWTKLLYATVSGLPSAFGCVFKGVFTIREDSTYSTWNCVSNCCNFPFQLRWCFPEFVVSSSKVMKFEVTYVTCPAVCLQSPVSLNTEGIKVPGELLLLRSRFLSSHPKNTMSSIHIILFFCCLSTTCKQLQLSQLNCLCAISNACYQTLRKLWNTETHISIS